MEKENIGSADFVVEKIISFPVIFA